VMNAVTNRLGSAHRQNAPPAGVVC